MHPKIMNFMAQLRKTGFGLGFILGGLFIGAVALWTGYAHAHEFKQSDLLTEHTCVNPSHNGMGSIRQVNFTDARISTRAKVR